MTEEVLNEGVTETPATDDLRSALRAAVDAQRGSDGSDTEVSRPARADVTSTDAQPGQKAPAAEKGIQQQERTRDEQGRFVVQQEKTAQKTDAGAQQVADPSQQAMQADQQSIRPPPGWSPKSKAAFDALPPEVKADIAKREQEVNQGFAKLAEYKGIERFAEQARSSGTTLEAALTNYTNWESEFKRDPFSTVAHLSANLGIHPVQFAQTLLQRLGGGQGQQQAGADQNTMQIHPALLKELAQLKSTVANQESERTNQQRQAVTQNVETFFADPKNKYADNVSEIMVGLINQAKASGQKIDLPTIYETACFMHPEVRELLINERTSTNLAASNAARANAAAQARSAAKAVTGAPTGGTAPVGAPRQNMSLRDTIRQAAMDQADS